VDERSRVQQLLAQLEAWLRRHRAAYLKELRPGAGAADLAALDKALAAPAPDELRALLAWHNGQNQEFTGRFEEDWMLLSTAEIAETRRDLASGWVKSLIPFLDDDDGNYLGIDTSTAEHPVCACGDDKPEQRRVVARSLVAWLEDFVAAVEAGRYREDPERGSFLRSEG
jgi:cell wall assembly regulator SMI1